MSRHLRKPPRDAENYKAHIPPPKKLVGLMVARNEDWIIGFSLRVALMWCDAMVVSVHRSTDRTAKIVEQVAAEHPGRVCWEVNDDPLWHEMFHRDRTLELAREMGATHCAIIDADEAMTHNVLQRAREAVLALAPHMTMTVPMIPAWRGVRQYRVDDCPWSRAVLSLAFADGPGIKWRPANNGNHFHRRFPDQTMTRANPRRERAAMAVGKRRTIHPIDKPMKDGGGIHFQFAHWDRLRAKHVWYRMKEVILHPGLETPEQLNAKYSLALNETGLLIEPMRREWYVGYENLMSLIDLESEPWHLADCRRMLKEHGRETFAGLDLLGLC